MIHVPNRKVDQPPFEFVSFVLLPLCLRHHHLSPIVRACQYATPVHCGTRENAPAGRQLSAMLFPCSQIIYGSKRNSMCVGSDRIRMTLDKEKSKCLMVPVLSVCTVPGPVFLQ